MMFSTWTSAKQCSSFSTNGSAASNFANYRFYDMRNIPNDTWDTLQNTTGSSNASAAAFTNDMSWRLDWAPRNGLRVPDANSGTISIDYQSKNVAMRNVVDRSDNNVTTALGLATYREDQSSQQSSGIDFCKTDLMYISLRVRTRISGAKGACAGFFTYKNDTTEIDIEVLTRNDNTTLGLKTQPTVDDSGDEIKGSQFNMSFPFGLIREDWMTYRLDWVASHVVWYVEGVQMAGTTVNVPVDPSHLYINLWGNGGTWTGEMALGQSALLEIQWVELAYNLSNTTPVVQDGTNICNLDDPGLTDPAQRSFDSQGRKISLNAVVLLSTILAILEISS
ncbi:hypothetical protein SCUP234_09970 [Seiridium cupressi]